MRATTFSRNAGGDDSAADLRRPAEFLAPCRIMAVTGFSPTFARAPNGPAAAALDKLNAARQALAGGGMEL